MFSQNLLMLGKTYLKLDENEKARYFLKLASLYPPRTDDDLQVSVISINFICIHSVFSGGVIAYCIRIASLLLVMWHKYCVGGC